jgi:hypothetical protein
MAKTTTPSWEGILIPVRLLSSDEVEELGESCHVCGGTAHVVEAITPLTPDLKKQALSDFAEGDLRYTCGLHSPIDVPTHVLDSIDLEFYQRMKRPLICPDRGWEKYYTTCLRLQPACLKRCISIKGRLPEGVSLADACKMIERGRQVEDRRKKKEKIDADKE